MGTVSAVCRRGVAHGCLPVLVLVFRAFQLAGFSLSRRVPGDEQAREKTCLGDR